MKTRHFPITAVVLACLITLAALPALAAEEQAATQLSIEEAVICRDVIDREPVGQADVFPKDLKKVMCFTRVVGSNEPTEIYHNWFYGEKMVASVPLNVASSNWRTYSSKTILPEYTGEWKVEIISRDGEVLKKIYFIIE